MNLDMFSLKGKTAIVTGCGAGLGQAMAEGLAMAGANIVGIDIADMSKTEKLISAQGAEFRSVQANMMDFDTYEAVVQECQKAFGSLDILLNNAGIIRRNDVLAFSEKDWDDVIDLNLKAVFFFSQNVAKAFRDQGWGGKIINIASMLSFQGGIRIPSYTASKSGVMGLTKLLANELAVYGIQVNAIAPGYFATHATQALQDDEKRNREILERIPAGRWGTPADLQGAAVFLASHASDYVTGYTIAVDGGWLAR